MRQLKEHDWINEKEEKKVGKGRPLKIYYLKVGFNKIIVQLENQQRKADVEAQKNIEHLRAFEGIWEIINPFISELEFIVTRITYGNN